MPKRDENNPIRKITEEQREWLERHCSPCGWCKGLLLRLNEVYFWLEEEDMIDLADALLPFVRQVVKATEMAGRRRLELDGKLPEDVPLVFVEEETYREYILDELIEELIRLECHYETQIVADDFEPPDIN